MNECTACDRDFGSLKAFDAHRVGRYPQTGPADWLDRIRAGLVDVAKDWTPDAGRRCLDDDELEVRGFVRNHRGSWSLARDLERGTALRRSGEGPK